MKDDLLKNLNPQQLQAVTHKNGPLLIIAGAGTGKTKVITHRIAWLIEQKLAKPSEILALTFTEKTAAEMETRVDVLVPYGYVDTWISTFHAFGDRILRENYLELGISGTYEILTKTDQMIWLKNHLFEFPLEYFRPLSNPLKHLDALISFISRCKDELITPDDYLTYARELSKRTGNEAEKLAAKKQFELGQFYQYYQELLVKEGKFDFGDLITQTYQLFLFRPDILKKYQQQFKYILVDEFQDTNYAQNELIKLLASRNGNITVVGDDDQSIYKFRGAAISNILDFQKFFPQAKLVVLKENYRSPQAILDSAYCLIQNNNPDRLEVKNQINKKLLSSKKGLGPQIIHTYSSQEQVQQVIKKIKEIYLKAKSYQLIAILARANDHLEPFIQALSREKIPYLFSGQSGLGELKEIKLLSSLIKALTNPLDSLAHCHLLSSEFYNLSVWQVNKINAYIKNRHLKFLSVLEKINQLGEELNLEKNILMIIKKYLDDLCHYSALSSQCTGGQLLYQYLSDKQYLTNLLKNHSPQNELKIKNIAKFFQKIKNWEKFGADKSIYALAENLEDLTNFLPEKDSSWNIDFDAVNLLTVHAAKGLEFETVFVIDLVQDRFPSRRQNDPLELPQELIKESLPSEDYHLQEERRLFYVAMTRAKKELYLCWADDYGGLRQKKPSIFLAEALDQSQLALPRVQPDLFSSFQTFALPFEEKEVKLKIDSMKRFGKLLLNAHKIDDYLTCPLKFKYIHILQIPVLKYHHVAYGRAIHEAIRFYFDHKLKKLPISLDDLLKTFQNNWDSEGFISREHEEKRFQAGIQSLSRFYAKTEQSAELPFAIEKSFKFALEDILITGRFDLIYQRPPACVEISDVKTSEIETQEKADQRAKDSNQLAVYALAWQKLEGSLPNLVSLRFIDSDLIGRYRMEEKRLQKIKNDIQTVKQGMESLDFSPNPSYNNCHYCAYKSICPDKYKGA